MLSARQEIGVVNSPDHGNSEVLTSPDHDGRVIKSADYGNGGGLVFSADSKSSAGIIMNVGKVETTNNIYNTIIV